MSLRVGDSKTGMSLKVGDWKTGVSLSGKWQRVCEAVYNTGDLAPREEDQTDVSQSVVTAQPLLSAGVTSLSSSHPASVTSQSSL